MSPDPITICFAAYHIYQAIKLSRQTINWAEAHYRIGQLECDLSDLLHSRPGDYGHSEWARQDGFMDGRMRPVVQLKRVLSDANEACRRKDGHMLMACLSKLVPGEEIMEGLQSLRR